MKPLTPAERRDLRAQAHHLDPVVLVGHHGLTPAILHEVDLALAAHELVKVRIASDDRELREAALARFAAELDCAPVQHVGKVLVLWRPDPDKKKKKAEAAAPKPAKRARKAGPRAPVDAVRERRRQRGDEGAAASGKGRRGAARFGVAEPVLDATEAPPSARRKSTEVSPSERRKSSFTPKTKPKSFGAKPNPRSAWEKDKDTERAPPKSHAKPRAKPAATGAKAPAGPRRRRTTT